MTVMSDTDELTFDDKYGACPVCTHPYGECSDQAKCPYWSPDQQEWHDKNWTPKQR